MKAIHLFITMILFLGMCSGCNRESSPATPTATTTDMAIETSSHTPSFQPTTISTLAISSSTTPPLHTVHADSFSPSISADGRYVAFASRATDLIPLDGNWKLCTTQEGQKINCTQIHIYDRVSKTMKLFSASEDGLPLNGVSGEPHITADGRLIAFTLGGGARVMQNPFFESQAVEQARVLAGKDPVISTDGRFVAYSGQNEAYGWDVYVYDRQSGQTELISKALEGVSDGVNWWPAISGDGRWVALWSWAGNLVADDLEVCRQGERNNYSCGDVFIHDRETGQMDRIPVGMGYGIGMGEETLSLSEDGSRVRYLCKVYDRQMDQFLCEDCCNAKLSGNGLFSIFRKGVEFFVKDLSTGAVTMVSVTSDGVPSNGEWVGFSDPEYALWHEAMFEPGCDISNDGQWAVFASPASNLDLDDTYVCSDWPFVSHNCYDVFIHNLVTGITEWISKPYK